MESGKHTDRMIITNGDFGYILTASYPIVYNGKTVAAVGVEIPMATLKEDIRTYVISVLEISGLIMIVLLALGVFYIVRTLIRPIGIVVAEAEKFVDNNAEISDKLGKIKTKDEIQVLSDSILQMETEIKDYIENIKAVTAEKERIGAELNVATQIQADMLPSIFPAFPGRNEFDIFASMTPAKEVGGDFYDFFLIDDDHLGMVMADVSGKGVPAALFMVIAKTLIKNSAQAGEYSPSKILSDVNEQLCEGNKAELFVTVWLAIVEISTGKGMAANAGHEHPVLKRKGGKYELIQYRHSPAVATMEGMKFREHEFEMNPGDSLFVYTDGVPEATNAQNELFGTERMLDALNSVTDPSNEELLKNVKKCVDEFVGDAPQFDDLTMLGMTYYGKEGV
jgi:sigma-B regulation protein RsbU (phosphoserine phosphatase)